MQSNRTTGETRHRSALLPPCVLLRMPYFAWGAIESTSGEAASERRRRQNGLECKRKRSLLAISVKAQRAAGGVAAGAHCEGLVRGKRAGHNDTKRDLVRGRQAS